MESLFVVLIFAVVSIAVYVLAEKYLVFDFFTNLVLFICILLLVMLIGSLVVYYVIPFKKEVEGE